MAKPIRVYTTAYCGYCRMAKELLRRKGLGFEEIDVSGDDAARRWLVDATGRYTVPQIFIGEEAIGGYDELRSLEDRGELGAIVGD
jgi:glutaredoxin 3